MWRLSHAECESHITPFHKTQYDELSNYSLKNMQRNSLLLCACSEYCTARKEWDGGSLERSHGRSSEKKELWEGQDNRG